MGCVHECAAILNIPLSAHCMPCSCHMSSVQSRSLTMSSHTHHVSATCVVHSVLASLVHSLCTSAADPLSDLEGVRRAASGECDVFVCLFVCLLTVSLTLHPTHTHVAVVVLYRYYTVCHYMQ